MALDFPSNPNAGDQYISSNTIWTWDGFKWTASGVSEAYLPLIGGTMSGSLILKGDPTANLEAATKQYADTKLPIVGGTVGPNAFIVNGPAQFNNYAAFTGAQPTVFNTQAQFNNGATFGTAQVFFNSPVVFSANAQGVTPPADDNSQLLATTAWVNNRFGGSQNRNRLINGNFLVNQRNSGAGITPTQGQFVIDRWRASLSQAAKFTTSALAITSGAIPAPYTLAAQSSSAYTSLATELFGILHPIEYINMIDFGWGSSNAQPVTLSFWAAASTPGIYSGSLVNNAQTRSYPFTFNLPNTNWNFITINIPGDTTGTWSVAINNAGAYLYFDLGCGANARGPANAWSGNVYWSANGAIPLVSINGAALQFANVQLELGPQATPFDWKSYDQVLLSCKRYFQTINFSLYNQVANLGNWYGSYVSHNYPVSMRAAPTVTIAQNAVSGWAGTAQAQGPNITSCAFTPSTTQPTAGAYFLGTATLNAEL